MIKGDYATSNIDDFLKKQEYIRHNEQEINVNYDFINGKPANFTGFVPLQDILLKMNWSDYHLKNINFKNVFLKTSNYNLCTKEHIYIKRRCDIQLIIRNDLRDEPTRFISLTINQARGERDYRRHEKWDYNNEEEYKKAIKTAVSKKLQYIIQ